MAKSEPFWTYKDASGVDVVVQRFEDIPQQYRSKATTLDAAAGELHKKASDVVGHMAPSAKGAAASVQGSSLHMPSLLAGAGGALVVALMVLLVFRSRAKLVLGMLMIATLAAGYFTFMRQEAGLGAELASPQTIVNDAKAAAEALQQKMEKQGSQLKEIEK